MFQRRAIVPQMAYERFYRFCRLIDGIHKNINRIKVDLAPDLGVKSVHLFWIYELLMHSEGLTASELASRTMISRSLISREIEELRQEGYIQMSETSRGKRKNYNSHITLTEKGQVMAKSIAVLGNRFQLAAGKGISEEQLTVFYDVLEKLSSNLSEISKEFDFSDGGFSSENITIR